jgi:hypothetical protein
MTIANEHARAVRVQPARTCATPTTPHLLLLQLPHLCRLCGRNEFEDAKHAAKRFVNNTLINELFCFQNEL